jgi:2-alkenal reductase
VSDVTPLGSGLVWDQRGYVVTTYGGVARAGSAPAASTSQSSSAAAAPGSGAPVPPAAPLVKGASVAQSAMPVAGRQLRVSILDVSDGQMKQWTATVVGTSPLHNLAVLLLSDVPQESLAPVQLGSNADIRVGQAAFAVGLPFGQSSHALSYGVISGARRPVPSGIPGLLLPGGAFLTDATVDNVTSGGALVDSSGRLMGMLLAPPNATRASALGLTRPSSLAFAVPVDVVTRIVPQLIAYGEPRQT